jgi:hypothetical protein
MKFARLIQNIKMKLKFNGFLVLLVLVAQITFAQENFRCCSDNAGIPLPGVSVLVKEHKLEHKLIFLMEEITLSR